MTVCPENDPKAWGSHLPALLYALSKTVGDVLEVGVGHFSTPALHNYCLGADRNLVSVEDNPEWFTHFRDRYQRFGHAFISGPYDQSIPFLAKSGSWAVAFIDNSPGGARRRDDFVSLLPVSKYVIVHDYHLENEDAIKPLLTNVNHSVYTAYQPPTLIASLTGSVPILK